MTAAGTAARRPVRGEIHAGLDGLAALQPEWQRLVEHGAPGGFSVSHACYEALLRYRHPQPDQVQFFCLRDALGEPLAICPLEAVRRRIRRVPLRAWQFPADPDRPTSAFVLDPEIRPADILPVLLPLLRASAPAAGVALLERVAADSATMAALRSSVLASRTLQRAPMFCLELGEPAAQVLGRASKKFRFNVRWGRRRMQQLGTLEHRVAAEPAILRPALDAFLALEAAGWKGTHPSGRAIALRPDVERHARGLVALAGDRGECEIHGLWLGERCVAALVGLLGPGETYVFKVARDESFPAFSLGHLLVEDVIEHGRQRALGSRLNFGWEAEWMRPWGGQLVELQDVYLSLGGWRGRFAWMLLGARRDGH